MLRVDIEDIITAIRDERLLEIVYTNYSGKSSKRQVEPYWLFLKSADWYLIAFCLYKRTFKIFKLSRITVLKYWMRYLKSGIVISKWSGRKAAQKIDKISKH
ncbi:MAG: WYL domain-containing protein [Spirochaetaceae bacterium]|jgi:predicted DNA-binding transcriptional regulator YafY|nr:WYL domain-containing protein [Spirochaetaceae bacterium]